MSVSACVSKFLMDTLNLPDKEYFLNFTNIAFNTLKTTVLQMNAIDKAIEYRVSPFVQKSNTDKNNLSKPEINVNNNNNEEDDKR